jgi:hypothetical protein
MAAMAAADPSSGTNPVPLTVKNLSVLFTQAIEGRLEPARRRSA